MSTLLSPFLSSMQMFYLSYLPHIDSNAKFIANILYIYMYVEPTWISTQAVRHDEDI